MITLCSRWMNLRYSRTLLLPTPQRSLTMQPASRFSISVLLPVAYSTVYYRLSTRWRMSKQRKRRSLWTNLFLRTELIQCRLCSGCRRRAQGRLRVDVNRFGFGVRCFLDRQNRWLVDWLAVKKRRMLKKLSSYGTEEPAFWMFAIEKSRKKSNTNLSPDDDIICPSAPFPVITNKSILRDP